MTDIRGPANVEYSASIPTAAARSRIENADSAAGGARLAIAHALQQIGAAMPPQANAMPELALSRIR